jgi:hypothetical protein
MQCRPLITHAPSNLSTINVMFAVLLSIADACMGFAVVLANKYHTGAIQTGLYRQPLDSQDLISFFLAVEAMLPFLRVTLCHIDNLVTGIPSDFNVIPVCWLLLSTIIDATTFSLMIECTDIPGRFQFNSDTYMAAVNSLPDLVTDYSGNYAHMYSQSATIKYLKAVIYTSLIKNSLVNNEPYICGLYPNVLAPLDNPIKSQSFLKLAPYAFDEPRILDSLQRLSFNDLVLVNSRVHDIQSKSNRLPVWPILERIAQLVSSPAGKLTCVSIIESYSRFSGNSKALLLSLVYCKGAIVVFELWEMLHYPTCRMTYQPITMGFPNSIYMPYLAQSYIFAHDANVKYGYYMDWLTFVNLVAFNLSMDVTATQRDGTLVELTMPQKIAKLMCSGDPFGTTDMRLQFTESFDAYIVQTAEPLLFLNEKMRAWRNPGESVRIVCVTLSIQALTTQYFLTVCIHATPLCPLCLSQLRRICMRTASRSQSPTLTSCSPTTLSISPTPSTLCSTSLLWTATPTRGSSPSPTEATPSLNACTFVTI